MHSKALYLEAKPQPDMSASAFVSWLACSWVSQRFQANSQKQEDKQLVQILLIKGLEKPNNPQERVNDDTLLSSKNRKWGNKVGGDLGNLP